jgi:hypothetical protein
LPKMQHQQIAADTFAALQAPGGNTTFDAWREQDGRYGLTAVATPS